MLTTQTYKKIRKNSWADRKHNAAIGARGDHRTYDWGSEQSLTAVCSSAKIERACDRAHNWCSAMASLKRDNTCAALVDGPYKQTNPQKFRLILENVIRESLLTASPRQPDIPPNFEASRSIGAYARADYLSCTPFPLEGQTWQGLRQTHFIHS